MKLNLIFIENNFLTSIIQEGLPNIDVDVKEPQNINRRIRVTNMAEQINELVNFDKYQLPKIECDEKIIKTNIQKNKKKKVAIKEKNKKKKKKVVKKNNKKNKKKKAKAKNKKKNKKKKAKAKKSSKKNTEPEDSGIVIVDDDLTIDRETELEERRAYLEEARSQEASSD